MVKKFDIWKSEIDLDEWQGFLEEDREVNPDFYEGRDPDAAAYDAVCEENASYLDDERTNLNIQLEHPILIIADLGLWDGRRKAYKLIESGNIRDILYSQTNGMSECHWYCDGYNICCKEAHHDGTNHYTYREIRNEDNIDRFLEKLYYGKPYSASTLNHYTRSIAKDVARVYGLCA